MVIVTGVRGAREVEGVVGDRPLLFFPYGEAHAALVGIDLENALGKVAWRVGVIDAGGARRDRSGAVVLRAGRFPVERLSLPTGMVDLDPATERRAEAVIERDEPAREEEFADHRNAPAVGRHHRRAEPGGIVGARVRHARLAIDDAAGAEARPLPLACNGRREPTLPEPLGRRRRVERAEARSLGIGPTLGRGIEIHHARG